MWNQAKAVHKFILSFRTREWSVEDYPLQVIDRGDAEGLARLRSLRWTVQIINWAHMRGDADTKEAALDELHQRLDRHRAERGSLPRPGTGRKLEVKFAASERVEASRELVDDIIRRVIGMDLSTVSFRTSQRCGTSISTKTTMSIVARSSCFTA